jgi:Flp pilus assembly protein TadG
MRFPIRLRAPKRLISAAVSDRRGVAAIIMALCAPVLILMIGFAIDYGYALNVNQRLNEAADSAVLAVTSPSATSARGGIVQGASGCSSSSTACWSYYFALNTFTFNTSNLPIAAVTPTLSITNVNNKITATLTYSTSVPTFFSGIVGMSTIPISGHAQATASPLTYVNYYILLDVSNSMGIAASLADQQALFTATLNKYGQGCQFGCHVPDTGQTVTNEYLAHSLSTPVTLRIDAAKTAILDIINAAANLNSNGNIKIGLYTMNQDPNNSSTALTVTQVQAPTTSQSALTTAVGNIDLGGNLVTNGSSRGDTNFSQQLTDFTTYFKATTNGTGLTPSSPLNYVLIVTDGVADTTVSPCPVSTNTQYHCVSAFDPTMCTSLKAASTVGVIYTTYDPIYNDPRGSPPPAVYTASYNDLVAPFASNIYGNLLSCASSSQYFLQADEGPEIITAAQALFANTLQTARLTQ